MTEGALDGHDIAAGRDQARRVEVPQVVEPDVRELGRVAGRPPPPGDRVVVERVISNGEQPLVWLALTDVGCDMLAEDDDQLVGQIDDPPTRTSGA